MHPVLLEKMDGLKHCLQNDPRCLGMFLGGSLGRQTADEFSDIDLYLVIREPEYAAFKKEFRAVCEGVFGDIQVWLPEAESPTFVNYAFLFKAGPDLLLYDLAVGTDAAGLTSSVRRAQQVLIDRTGLVVGPRPSPKPTPPRLEELRTIIDNFWVYTYLNGKYFRRADVYKMLYVQGVLFHNHLSVLRSLYPETEWTWWADDVHKLPAGTQQELLVYFGSKTVDQAATVIPKEMDLLSRDAREACRKWDLDYPSSLEANVREHLRRMGLPLGV